MSIYFHVDLLLIIYYDILIMTFNINSRLYSLKITIYAPVNVRLHISMFYIYGLILVYIVIPLYYDVITKKNE